LKDAHLQCLLWGRAALAIHARPPGISIILTFALQGSSQTLETRSLGLRQKEKERPFFSDPFSAVPK
jgi:hypothetical protein